MENTKNEELAAKITTLFSFAATMIPDIETLADLVESSRNRKSYIDSAAVIIEAFGKDSIEKSIIAELHAKRAKALLDLIIVLRDTEAKRLEFLIRQKHNDASLKNFSNNMKV